MDCTIKNIEKICKFIEERHFDNIQGADFAIFDDESDLLNSFKTAIDMIKESEV